MPKKRLNITVDPHVAERARRYSKRHDTSISKLVTDFLSGLPDEDEPREHSPAVRRLLGVATDGPDREECRKHLDEKYGP